LAVNYTRVVCNLLNLQTFKPENVKVETVPGWLQFENRLSY